MNAALILPLTIDLLLKSSLVVLFALIVLAVWKRASAGQRSLVWVAAFAVIITLPAWRMAAPHWTLSLPKSHAAVAMPQQVAPRISFEPKPAALEEVMAAPSAMKSWPELDPLSVAVSLWSAGAILLLGYRCIGSLLLQRFHRASSSVAAGSCRNLALSIASAYGIQRPIDLRLSKACRVPMTWGTRRPVILLPDAALEWPREWLEAALRHEMSHIKNRDHLTRWIATLACAFYWPNPLVWLAARQLHLAQEEAADNLVLQVGISSQDYAVQLVETIRATAGLRPISLPAVAMARPSTLEGRLAAILDDSRNRDLSGGRMLMATIALALALGATLSAAQLRAEDPALQTDVILPTAESTQQINDTIRALVIPTMDFRQTSALGAINAMAKVGEKANPRSLPVEVSAPLDPKMDLHLSGGPLIDGLKVLTKQFGLQYKLSPLYVFYMDEIGAPLRPHLEKIYLSAWPANSPEPTIGRTLAISGEAARILKLPVPTGDARESLKKWGIQFPAGTSAETLPLEKFPGRYQLSVTGTADQVIQVIKLLMAAAPNDWMPKAPTATTSTSSTALTSIQSPDEAAQAKLIEKVNTLVIPSLDLNQVTIGDALQAVITESKKADPDHQGINFVVREPAPTTKLDLKGTSILLKDVLNSIANQTKLQYSVESYAVYFRPAVEEDEVLTVRTFLVPDQVAASLLSKPPASGDVSQSFANIGIKFPAGAKATYLPDKQKLVVRNTPKQLDLISNFFDKFPNPPSALHP